MQKLNTYERTMHMDDDDDDGNGDYYGSAEIVNTTLFIAFP